jgi:site-specific DNA-methyltransferase (adenine-specific)
MKSEVYNEDCMIGMARYPDKYFDLAVVDPPYGIREDGHRENHTRSKMAKSKKYHDALWDQGRPTKEYFTELIRISKHQIIWGVNHLADLFNPKSSCYIVWNKKVMSGMGNHFADCEIAFCSHKTAVRSFEFEWQGMIQGDMKNKEIRIHPTQKPVALYSWIYDKYLPEGGKVIDTHLGSGSNRIAADKAGNIDFYGWEIDKDYFEAQEKRFKEYKSQLKIQFAI